MYEKMIVGLGQKVEKKIYYAKLKRHWDEIKKAIVLRIRTIAKEKEIF